MESGLWPELRNLRANSLRRHDPHQVRRVRMRSVSVPAVGRPCRDRMLYERGGGLASGSGEVMKDDWKLCGAGIGVSGRELATDFSEAGC
jgi:hypothetical protein